MFIQSCRHIQVFRRMDYLYAFWYLCLSIIDLMCLGCRAPEPRSLTCRLNMGLDAAVSIRSVVDLLLLLL